MTLLLLAAAALSVAVLAILLWPLLRSRAAQETISRADLDLGICRDQLAEVERDVARGLLPAQEAEAARVEIKRRMLAALDAEELPPRTAHRPYGLAAALALLLPATAAALYFSLGAPGSVDQPLAERRGTGTLVTADTGEQPQSLEQAAAQLAKRLQDRPDDAGGWFLLGRAYLTLGRPRDAADALQRASALAPQEADVAAAYAEAVIAAADGQMNDEARTALRRLLALDPLSPQARFLLAIDRAQNGDLAGAAQDMTDLLALAPADAPWVMMVREQRDQTAQQAGLDAASLAPSADALQLAAQAAAGQAAAQVAPKPDAQASGPGPEDVEAARQMRPEERSQMIRGMVDRLAARLQQEPDDLEGWRRLARAYEVLGEREKAADARARISALEGR